MSYYCCNMTYLSTVNCDSSYCRIAKFKKLLLPVVNCVRKSWLDLINVYVYTLIRFFRGTSNDYFARQPSNWLHFHHIYFKTKGFCFLIVGIIFQALFKFCHRYECYLRLKRQRNMPHSCCFCYWLYLFQCYVLDRSTTYRSC